MSIFESPCRFLNFKSIFKFQIDFSNSNRFLNFKSHFQIQIDFQIDSNHRIDFRNPNFWFRKAYVLIPNGAWSGAPPCDLGTQGRARGGERGPRQEATVRAGSARFMLYSSTSLKQGPQRPRRPWQPKRHCFCCQCHFQKGATRRDRCQGVQGPRGPGGISLFQGPGGWFRLD